MSEDRFAISRISPAPVTERDYESICAALMQTERGRWFLQEFARRNRSGDTQILLAAIERIEAVVSTERSRPVQQGFRSDLREMAEAITRTRAEVAEIRAGAAHPAAGASNGEAARVPPRSSDVFAAAERIRDVTWAMRGHGFDPSTCDQLEELAGAILSASSLRDPGDHRASKLSEVLQYLEHQIEALLESDQDGDAAVPEPEHDAFEPALAEETAPLNAPADAFAAAECEPAAGGARASPQTSGESALYGFPVTAHDDLEGDAPLPVAIEIPPPDVPHDPALEPRHTASAATACGDPWLPEFGLPGSRDAASRPPHAAAESAPSQPISTQNHEVAAQTSDQISAAERGLSDGAEPPPADQAFADAAPALAMEPPSTAMEASGANAGRPTASLGGDAAVAKSEETLRDAAADASPDTFLPPVELPRSYRLLRKSPAARAATALREAAARTFLPEIDMGSDARDLSAAPAHGVQASAGMPTEPADLGSMSGMATQPLLPATPQLTATEDMHAAPALTAAVLPQHAGGDPLAALKGMSDNELIALFS